MFKEYKTYYNSNIGVLEIIGTQKGILSVSFLEEKSVTHGKIPHCLKECYSQIDEYFKGNRKKFSVKIQLEGTDFQNKVWKQLIKIPFGKTVSYKDIAVSVGNKNAVRAVGNANGKNRISIIIPCHRVIGINGKLVGFGAGLWRKEWLLKHESSCLKK